MANMTRVLNEEQKNILREAKAMLDVVVTTLNRSKVKFEDGQKAVQSMATPNLYCTYSACNNTGMVMTYKDTVITLIKYINNEWMVHTACAMRFSIYSKSDEVRYGNLLRSKSKFVDIRKPYTNIREVSVSNCSWIK